MPELRGPDDTSHFDEDLDQSESSHAAPRTRRAGAFSGEPLTFVGYSYRRTGPNLDPSAVSRSMSVASLAVSPDVFRRSGPPSGDIDDVAADLKRAQQEAERWKTKYQAEKKVRCPRVLRRGSDGPAPLRL